MYQGFPGDYDSTSRCSSSPSAESQYLSSVDSFGSPTAAAASQSQPQGQQLSHQQQQQPPPPAVDPYDLPGTSYSTPGMGAYSAAPSAAATPSSRPARARPRRTREEMVSWADLGDILLSNFLWAISNELTPEEEEKRRVRRERNKLAAAKCRNRRRELTDRLQAETDQLEEEKAGLESEIAELRKEKDRLEFVLVAHKPSCKIPYEDMPELGSQPGPSAEVSSLGVPVKEDPFGPAAYPSVPLHYQQSLGVPAPGAPGPAEVAFSSSYFTHAEPLTDPYPVNPSYTSSFVFTYPEGSTCGATHQRNSSSDQSSDSLNSPSLLAL
ncbi:protein FosB isoform X3 [Carettochelys insculpta]|uniref:protein FosB isoform X3 n=1 Tax=Carettochelys insculpta TaxID=44489 RepID=UPI003EBADEF1